jgi:hypothetical protein
MILTESSLLFADVILNKITGTINDKKEEQNWLNKEKYVSISAFTYYRKKSQKNLLAA